MSNTYPTPWKWKGNEGDKMSAVVDAEGGLVCGSLICQQYNRELIKAHKLIVQAVNEHVRKVVVKQQPWKRKDKHPGKKGTQ